MQVYIEDQNDNFPEFRPSEYFKSINYDEPISTTILSVKVKLNSFNPTLKHSIVAQAFL